MVHSRRHHNLSANFIAVLLFGSFGAIASAASVTLCHTDPNNPGGAHTITVDASLAAAYMALGDFELTPGTVCQTHTLLSDAAGKYVTTNPGSSPLSATANTPNSVSAYFFLVSAPNNGSDFLFRSLHRQWRPSFATGSYVVADSGTGLLTDGVADPNSATPWVIFQNVPNVFIFKDGPVNLGVDILQYDPKTGNVRVVHFANISDAIADPNSSFILN